MLTYDKNSESDKENELIYIVASSFATTY